MRTHPLDNYIQLKIQEELKQHESIIKKEDAKLIIDSLMPLIDEIVAKKIKQHLRILTEYMSLKTLNLKEESPGDAKNP